MKIDYGMNAIYALMAPLIHVVVAFGHETLMEGLIACLVTYVLCYGLLCGSDAVIVQMRKKIHGADTGTDRSPQG